MHRIRMHTRTAGCMQLNKPSYKASMYGIHDRELDLMQNSNGSEPHRYFFLAQNRHPYAETTKQEKSYFDVWPAFPIFFILKDRFDGQNFDSRVIKRKRVERSIRRRSCERSHLSYRFYVYLTFPCSSRGCQKKRKKEKKRKYYSEFQLNVPLRQVIKNFTLWCKLRKSRTRDAKNTKPAKVIFHIKLSVFFFQSFVCNRSLVVIDFGSKIFQGSG